MAKPIRSCFLQNDDFLLYPKTADVMVVDKDGKNLREKMDAINNQIELLENAAFGEVDLSQYVTKEQLNQEIANKMDDILGQVTAENISYTNDNVDGITNIASAIDYLLANNNGGNSNIIIDWENMLNKPQLANGLELTDTELIELAGMVEDLQDTLISSYYNYKNTLAQLKTTRSKMLLYSRNYNNALYGNDVMETAISTNLYDSMRLREFELEQSAKKYHIQLQRLAGKKAVDSLQMYQYDFDSVLYKDENFARKSANSIADGILNYVNCAN